MRRTATLGWVLAATLLVACRSRKVEVVPEQVTVRYCATTVKARNVERCVAEIPAEQQRRRERTTRLTYRNGQLQVDTQGKVTAASIGEDQIGNGSFGQCLLRSIRRPFAHGADRGCASIRLPLSFTLD